MTEAIVKAVSRAGFAARNSPLRGLIAMVLLLLALLLPALFSPVSVYGAEAPADRADPEPADPGKSGGTGGADREQSAGARAGKTEADEEGDFTPSEEISEDFAVSFPVDI